VQLDVPPLDQLAQAREGQEIVEGVDDRRLLQPHEVLGRRRVTARAELLRRRRDQRHPLADEIARRERLPVLGEGAHAAAMGMAEHDDVLDPQRADGEFERRGHAVIRAVGRIGRHQIGDVAHDEQLARPGVEDDFRRHPRVAAADDHDLGRLPALGQVAVAALLGRKPAGLERRIAVEQTLRQAHDNSSATADIASLTSRLSRLGAHPLPLTPCRCKPRAEHSGWHKSCTPA
jgi:hypothetical protein